MTKCGFVYIFNLEDFERCCFTSCIGRACNNMFLIFFPTTRVVVVVVNSITQKFYENRSCRLTEQHNHDKQISIRTTFDVRKAIKNRFHVKTF